ncbi:MAG: zinc metallopeptidase [bacterium]
MFHPFIDPLQIVFLLPALFLSLIATILIKYWSGKYLNQANISRTTGVDLVNRVAQKEHLDLRLDVINGSLTDNYDPRSRTLNLSYDVARGASITSVAIAAHELGHAIQHQKGSFLMTIRSMLLPALGIGTNLGYILLIIGIIINFTNLAWLGIILFSGAVIFSFLTLPIELDASRRGLALLRNEEILFADEMSGAKKVLFAAALTYLAAALQSLGQLLYFVLRVQRIGKRN